MRIGIVGDIHGGYFDLKAAVSAMGKVDHLLFTGDGYRDIQRLREEKPLLVQGVAGNCDFASEFPADQLIILDGFKIWLTHGHYYGVKSDLTRLAEAGREQGADLVIFGHTHQPLDTLVDDIRLFNPGTLCRERAYRGISYGMVETGPTGLKTAIIRL